MNQGMPAKPEAVNVILVRAENRGVELETVMLRIADRLNAVPALPQPQLGGKDVMPQGSMQQTANHIQDSLAKSLAIAEEIETILF